MASPLRPIQIYFSSEETFSFHICELRGNGLILCDTCDNNVVAVLRFYVFMCFLPLDSFFLSSLLLVFFLQVGPVGLVANAVALSGNVRSVLDHQTVVCSKAAILHILKKPPEGRRLLLRRHDSPKT